jgi:hypothetical protein
LALFINTSEPHRSKKIVIPPAGKVKQRQLMSQQVAQVDEIFPVTLTLAGVTCFHLETKSLYQHPLETFKNPRNMADFCFFSSPFRVRFEKDSSC